MGLKSNFIDAHINNWSSKLGAERTEPRSNWPKNFFHHCSLRNAADILKTERLCSRAELEGSQWEDCASQEVLANAADAHSYARLYFRPRNPTQYHVEGIKKSTDRFLNSDTRVHVPMLCFLVFDSKSILALNGIHFADGNAQHGSSNIGTGREFFSSIDFGKVFHDRPLDPTSPEGREIIRARCAEILVPDALPITDHLKRVYCRSHAERNTLLYLLDDAAENWEEKIVVASTQAMFFKQYAFVEKLELIENGFTFELHPRKDAQLIDTEFSCYSIEDQLFAHNRRAIQPGKWEFAVNFEGYDFVRAELKLEGHLASVSYFDTSMNLV